VSANEPPADGQHGAEPTEHFKPAEHFKPTGTIFILVMFVVALILLWASVYVILISRGVTV
jgi:hypothetical protein